MCRGSHQGHEETADIPVAGEVPPQEEEEYPMKARLFRLGVAVGTIAALAAVLGAGIKWH
jgi:hypothetical protein